MPESLNTIQPFSSKLGIAKGLRGFDEFYDVQKSLKGLSIDDAVNKLAHTNLNGSLSAELLESATNSDLLIGNIDGLSKSMQSLQNGTASFAAKAGNLFKGLGSIIASTLTHPATYIVGGLALGAKAIYDYATAFDKASEKSQQSQATYKNTISEISSLNTELQQTQNRIVTLESQGSLSLVEQSELDNLRSQSAELERQIGLREQLSNSQNQTAANDAAEALTLERTDDLTTAQTTMVGKEGREVTTYTKTDILTATESAVEQLKKYKNKRAEIEKEIAENGTSDSLKSELSNINSEIALWASAKPSDLTSSLQRSLILCKVLLRNKFLISIQVRI